MNTQTLDLQNADTLDESVLNAIGSMTPNFEYASNCCGANGENEDEFDNLTNESLLNANGTRLHDYKTNPLHDYKNGGRLHDYKTNPLHDYKTSKFKGGSLHDYKYANLTNESLLEAEGGSYVSPEMIQASATLTTALIANQQQKSASPAKQTKKELRAACGIKRPFLLKKKRQEYQKCVNEYLKSKQPVTVAPPTFDYSKTSTPSPDSGDKILGMPKGVAYAIGAVLAIGAVIVAVKVVKAKMK